MKNDTIAMPDEKTTSWFAILAELWLARLPLPRWIWQNRTVQFVILLCKALQDISDYWQLPYGKLCSFLAYYCQVLFRTKNIWDIMARIWMQMVVFLPIFFYCHQSSIWVSKNRIVSYLFFFQTLYFLEAGCKNFRFTS